MATAASITAPHRFSSVKLPADLVRQAKEAAGPLRRSVKNRPPVVLKQSLRCVSQHYISVYSTGNP